mmetsp:Transcript_28121/g.61130  ORF Transcript_28121/g.61130 Transcript_28121/m.61130 type:complete len:838 (+) Transcript_28121:67-2580(+)|eukprot:CAMPEP_0180576468 /NCGR_PEP_ID=MMETSP1037_2-20121125/11434_1 /TAXON_ID=632150 /ORGANISM="Azadinium spinosum, Strain 3D9" /LENGTH=837 /DNA_ID=CAMNT_0022594185 /DNA_START=1 /DNA_END=2514 /DNA_ORIENTATION=+
MAQSEPDPQTKQESTFGNVDIEAHFYRMHDQLEALENVPQLLSKILKHVEHLGAHKEALVGRSISPKSAREKRRQSMSSIDSGLTLGTLDYPSGRRDSEDTIGTVGRVISEKSTQRNNRNTTGDATFNVRVSQAEEQTFDSWPSPANAAPSGADRAHDSSQSNTAQDGLLGRMSTNSSRRGSVLSSSKQGLQQPSRVSNNNLDVPGLTMQRVLSGQSVNTSTSFHSSVSLANNSRQSVQVACGLGQLNEVEGDKGVTKTESISSLPSALQEDNLSSSPSCVLHPNSTIRLAWGALIIFTSMIVSWVYPIVLVYLDSQKEVAAGILCVLLLAIDMIWLLDIALNFRTGIVDGALLEFDVRKIAVAYLRGLFVIDLLAIWPLVLVPSGNFTMFVCMTLLKFLRLLHLPSHFKHLQKLFASTPWMMLKGSAVSFVLAHILTCLFRLAMRLDGVEDQHNNEWWSQYISDLYWTLQTMTAVGYGDIYPVGTWGKLYAVLTMTCSLLFSGLMISAIIHASQDWFSDPVGEKVVKLSRFMRSHRVPSNMIKRVQYNLRRHLEEQHRSTLDTALIEILSIDVKRELALALLNNTTLMFPLFRGAQRSFVSALAQEHTWIFCLAGDCVVERGHAVEELIFVICGRLMGKSDKSMDGLLDYPLKEDNMDWMRMDSEIPLMTKVDRMSETDTNRSGRSMSQKSSSLRTISIETGGWFGEACIFSLEHVRAMSLFAFLDSELAVLPAANFLKIVVEFPALKERWCEIVAEIKAGTMRIEEFAGDSRLRRRRLDEKFKLEHSEENQHGLSLWSHEKKKAKKKSGIVSAVAAGVRRLSNLPVVPVSPDASQ